MTEPRRLAWLTDSPLLDREKLIRARSWRTPLALAAYVCVLGGLAMVLFSLAIARAPDARPNAVDMARVAFLTVGFQLVLALLAVPPLAATAISGERERGTFDGLVLGRLGPGELVMAKLAAALAYPLLFLVAAVPVLVAVFLYAGLDLGQLLLVELVTVASVGALGALAVLVGLWLPSVLPSVLVSYVVVFALYGGSLLLGLVLQFEVPLIAGRGPSSSVHPVVFANPAYALHALVVGASPAGAHLGHLGRLLFLNPTQTSAWGPVIQPWQLSVAAQLGLTAACVWASARLLGPRSPHRAKAAAFPTFARLRRRLGTKPASPLVLLAAVAVAAVAVAAAVPGGASVVPPASAQPAGPSGPSGSSGISISAAPRWGRSTPGSWTAYVVTVRGDPGRALEGEVRLVPETSPRPGQDPPPLPASTASKPRVLALGQREMTVVAHPSSPPLPGSFPVHRAPVSLAGDSNEKRISMVVLEAPYGHRAELRNASGEVMAVSERLPGRQPQYTVGVLSTATEAADGLRRLSDFFAIGALEITAVPAVQDVPETAVGFSGLDAVVIDDFDTDGLAPNQMRALRDYVALGGSLVLGGAAAGTRAAATLSPELVPLHPSGTTVASLAALGRLVELQSAPDASVLTGELRSGRRLLETDDGIALVVQAEHGGGRIVQLTYDPLEEPFASDPALADLAWQQGVARALSGLVRDSGASSHATDAGLAPLEQLWASVAVGGRWAPWPGSGLVLLAVYGLGLIPLTGWLLRTSGRAKRLWMAVPIGAGVVAVMAAAGGEARRGRGQPTLKVTTVAAPGTAMTNTYQGIQGLGRDRLRFDVTTGAVSTLFTAPNLATVTPPASLRGSGGGEVRQGRGSALTVPTEPGEVRTAQVLSITDSPGLESRLRLVGVEPPESGGLRVVGTITNRSARPLSRLRVQLPEGAQARVGDVIEAGKTLAVDASLVWPSGLAPGTGQRSPSEELVMFAAADRTFTRPGQAVVVALDAGDDQGGDGLAVMVEPVALEATENPVAGTGRSHRVASATGGQNKVVYELDGLGGLGPVDLEYGTHASPPEVYDWNARSWRPLPPGDRSVGLRDADPLGPTEIRDGIVRVRARVEQTSTGFRLMARRP